MDDPQVFREALLASGLDIDRIIARAQQDDVKQKLIENTNGAVARGTFVSPTLFVGNEIYFGKDSLRDVEEEIVAQLGRRSARLPESTWRPDKPGPKGPCNGRRHW